MDADHNGYKTPVLQPGEPRERPTEPLDGEPATLSPEARKLIEDTVRRHCKIRGWTLLQVNARTKHIHVVVVIGEVEPELAVAQFKAWCTRALRDAGFMGRDQTVWTEGGSKRYLWTGESIDRAIKYVRDGQ